jgi:NarL family two-component system response regulator LiaR
MTTETTITILVVDDHLIVREGLISVLRTFPEFEIIGDASSGKTAIALCEKLYPDVVLMDLKMPQMSGVEATRVIRQRFPHTQVLVLTSFIDDELIQAALEAGAIGYLLKDASIHEIANAVRSVAQKQTVLAPEVMERLMHARMTVDKEEAYSLKSRELEVLRLMVEGLTNIEIAERIMLSKATVKYYISSIFEKLGVSTRTEAVVLAMQHHLVPQDSEVS